MPSVSLAAACSSTVFQCEWPLLSALTRTRDRFFIWFAIAFGVLL
jgi:hypothetical protein